MENSRILYRAMQWELRGYKRKPRWPRKNWVDVIKRNLKDMDIMWNIGSQQDAMASMCGSVHTEEV